MFFAPFATWFALLTLTPYGKLWKNDADRKRWIGALLQNNWKTRYRRTMRRILDRIDQTLSSHELKARASPARIAFSYGLINLSMLLALAYPVLGFIGQWIFGSALQMGNIPIAPTGTATARIFVSFWLLVPLFLYLFGTKTKSRLGLPLLILASVILYGSIFFASWLGVPNSVNDAFSFALFGTLAFAFLGALAFAYVFAGTLAFAFAFYGMLAFALSGTLEFAVAIAIALTFTESNFGPRPIFRVLYLLLMLLLVSALILLAPEFTPANKTPPTYLLLFLAIFPIFNALADFTSTGLTRYLLRRGLTKPVWFNALLDTIGGVLVFLLLGCTLISYIHLIRPQDDIPLLDLAALFGQLQNNPSDFWWLAIMLGSTLLPTLLHLMIGVATVLIQYPAVLRNWTIAKLTSGGDGSDTDGWQGSAMVCAMISASIWLPIILFYFLFTMNRSAVINGTIWLFSSYADLIGAL
jgi:hypothetical protein